MVGCPTTIMDAFRTLTYYCPPADIIAAVDGTYLLGVIAPADGRHAAWRATLFFSASARGS
jgi:hypothetical protein